MTLDELLALAEATTPGPWVTLPWPQRPAVYVYKGENRRRWSVISAGTLYRRDAAYIAAANPATIAALVKRAKAAEAVVEAARLVWQTVPATFEPEDMAPHAAALNAMRDALTDYEAATAALEDE